MRPQDLEFIPGYVAIPTLGGIESGMYDEEVFAKARDAIAAQQEENDNG